MSRSLVLAFLSLAALTLCGAERTVSNASELLDAVQALKSAGDVIYLEKGVYDLKDCEMSYNSNPHYHLVTENVRLVGKTGNARDVVLAGNGTHVILYANGSPLESLTISNGCRQASWSEDRSAGLYSKGSLVHSNIVVTSCRNLATPCGAIGGGGTYYNSLFCNNSTVNAAGVSIGGTFYNCVLSNNTAGANGGAVYWGAKLYDCQVLDNTAKDFGGGISGASDASSVCHVYGGLVAGNKVTNGYGGGAAYACFHGGTIVSNNTCTSNGGGIAGKAENIVSNTIICCNTATYGGGVHTCPVYGGRIESNSAQNGGGVYNVKLLGGGTVVRGNTASNAGGGARLLNGNSATNTVFCENVSYWAGGGVYLESGSTVVDCVISNNLASSASNDVLGGGMYAENQVPVVRDSKIVFNRVSSGGVNKYSCGAGIQNCTVSNCVIAGNAIVDRASSSNRSGAGAYGSALTDCIVRDNFMTSRYGVGQRGGSAIGCTFINNASTDELASGVYLVSPCVGCTISDRLVSGGVYDRCRFMNISNGCELAVGANVLTSGWFKAEATVFEGKTFAATNCLFTGNRTSTSLFYLNTSGATVDLVNCSVVSNRGQRMFYAQDATERICRAVNCLFVGNTTPDGSNPLNMYLSEANNRVSLENCLLGTSSWNPVPCYSYLNVRTNNLVRFVGGEKDPYQLPRHSPAIGWGAVQDWMADATDIRGEGYPRKRDGAVDLGCYQCWLPIPGALLMLR